MAIDPSSLRDIELPFSDILNNKICELESEVKETKNLIDYLTTLKVESETDFYNIGSAKK